MKSIDGILPHRRICLECVHLHSWLRQIASLGGIVGGKAVLIKLNRQQLCKSTLIVEENYVSKK